MLFIYVGSCFRPDKRLSRFYSPSAQFNVCLLKIWFSAILVVMVYGLVQQPSTFMINSSATTISPLDNVATLCLLFNRSFDSPIRTSGPQIYFELPQSFPVLSPFIRPLQNLQPLLHRHLAPVSVPHIAVLQHSLQSAVVAG